MPYHATGADKTPDSLREEFLHKHNITLLEGYGCTETSPVISVILLLPIGLEVWDNHYTM